MTEITEAVERATRPIVGMHNRTAQEVFDIMCDRMRFALQAAREEASQEGAGEPVAWPISVDGPHKITDQRAWLARQLMDSKNSDEEAFGIVAYHPAIRDAPPANDRTKALEEALDEATRWLLRYVEACGGKADASDYPGSPILLWCADRAEGDDTLNLAIERGYLTSGHDSDSDTSTIRLTDSGRRAVLALSPVQAVKGDGHG